MHENPPPTSLKTSFDPMARLGIWKKSARKLRRTWGLMGSSGFVVHFVFGLKVPSGNIIWEMRYSNGLSSLSHCSSSFFVLITIVHFDLTKIYSRGELKRTVRSGIARLSDDRIPDEGTHPTLQNNGILHWNSGDLETSCFFLGGQLVLSQKHCLNPQKPHISKPSARGIHNLFFQFLTVSAVSDFRNDATWSAEFCLRDCYLPKALTPVVTMRDPHPSIQRPRPTSSSLMLPKSINEEAAQIASGMGIRFGNNFGVSKWVDVGRIYVIDDLPTRDLKISSKILIALA